MVSSTLLDNVLALPLDDQRELYERLRKILGAEADVQPICAEHKRILDQRFADYELNPDAESSWDEVRAELSTRPTRK